MLKSTCILLVGILIGAILTLTIKKNSSRFCQAKAAPLSQNATPKYPLKATLYRFKLNKTNMPVYHEWVKWHYDAYNAMVESLEREKMYFECVFKDTLNDTDEIYWLAIDAENGASASTSALAIDKKHIEYMKQILIKGSRITLKTEFMLLPAFIEKSIAQHQALQK
ncbi:MAG TPA: DUF6176 family protein [Arachidicoccus sp.]